MTPRTSVSREGRWAAGRIAMYLGILTGTFTVIGTLVGGYLAWTGHREADLRREVQGQHENERRDQQIHQLQSVVGSEFPKYTPALDWVDK